MDTSKTAEFLKALRKANGLTQEEVAARLYLSPKTISRWESGSGMPDINIISGVADLYGVTVDEILRGERRSERTENLSEQTKRMKSSLDERLLCDSIGKKINGYMLAAYISLGAAALISFIFAGYYNLFIIPAIVIFTAFILVIGNSEANRLIKEGRELGYVQAMEKARHIVLCKNLIYTDIAAFILAVWVFMSQVIFLRYQNAWGVIAFIAASAGAYLTIRISFAVRGRAEIGSVVTFLNIAATFLAVFGILFILQLSHIEYEGSVKVIYTPIIWSAAVAKCGSDASAICALCFMIAALIAALCGAIFRKWWLTLSAIVLGVISAVIPLGTDSIYFDHVSPNAVFALVAAIVLLIVAAVKGHKIKNEAKKADL